MSLSLDADLSRFLVAFTKRLQKETIVLEGFKGYYRQLDRSQQTRAIDFLLKVYQESVPSRNNNTPHPFIIKAVFWATGGEYFKTPLDGLPIRAQDINDFKEHILIPIFQALDDYKDRVPESQAGALRDYVLALQHSPNCNDYREELKNMGLKFEAIAYERFSQPFQSGIGEIEQDASTLRAELAAVGFTRDLADCIDQLEKDLCAGETGFDFAATARTSRAFLESLHMQAAQKVGASPKNWGEATAALQAKNVISKKLELYVASLYTVISDHGVHPTLSKKEYARVFRNTVIEYAYLFLKLLQPRI